MSHPTLNQTIMTMMALHDGQVDKSGVPYFNHPLRVMLRLGENAPEAEQHAALMHDTMEDCGITPDILRDMGYSEEMIEIVTLVTRDKADTYRQFIYRIMGSGNIGAQRLKLADIYDNSSEVRRELLPPELRAEVESMIEDRYMPAAAQLKSVLGGFAEDLISEEMEVEIALTGEELGN